MKKLCFEKEKNMNSSEQRINSLINHYEKEIIDIKNEYEEKINTILQTKSKEMATLQKQYEKEIQELKFQHETQIKAVDSIAAYEKDLHEKTKEEISALKNELSFAKGEIKSLNNNCSSQKDIIKTAIKTTRITNNNNNLGSINIKQQQFIIPYRKFFPVKKEHIEKDDAFLWDLIKKYGFSDGLIPFYERYYYTNPPNIVIDDDSRKKIRIYNGESWSYVTVEELYEQVYRKSYVPILEPLFIKRRDMLYESIKKFRRSLDPSLTDREYRERMQETFDYQCEIERCRMQLENKFSIRVTDFWKLTRSFLLNLKNNDEKLEKKDHFDFNNIQMDGNNDTTISDKFKLKELTP